MGEEHKAGIKSLHQVVDRGSLDQVKASLAAGEDVNKKNEHKSTPLFLAAQRGDIRIAKLLLSRGAVVDSRNTFLLDSPLHAAAEQDHTEMARLLLANGADPNVINTLGQTPLHAAARMGYENVVRILLEDRAHVDARDCFRETALHDAARFGRKEAFELLLAEGADFGASNECGSTALHLAAGEGHVSTAKRLVELGLDPSAADAEGRTPLDRALESDADEKEGMLQLLRGHTGKSERDLGAAGRCKNWLRSFPISKTAGKGSTAMGLGDCSPTSPLQMTGSPWS